MTAGAPASGPCTSISCALACEATNATDASETAERSSVAADVIAQRFALLITEASIPAGRSLRVDVLEVEREEHRDPEMRRHVVGQGRALVDPSALARPIGAEFDVEVL